MEEDLFSNFVANCEFEDFIFQPGENEFLMPDEERDLLQQLAKYVLPSTCLETHVFVDGVIQPIIFLRQLYRNFSK